jgi:hypothetical protein
MVVKVVGVKAYGAVTRTKGQASNWLKSVEVTVGAVNIEAWRYHDGSGWADGSPESWEHIDALPSTVAVEIYR